MVTRRRRSTRSCRNCGRGRGRTTQRRQANWGLYLLVAVAVMIWIHENPGVIR